MCVASTIDDEQAGNLYLTPGMHTIEGVEALQFLRSRAGVGDGSDLGRISNQQQYLSSLVRTIASDKVLKNSGALIKLATTAVENVTPSQNLTNPLLLAQLAAALKSVPVGDIVFLQYPALEDPDNASHVVPDLAAADDMWAAILSNQALEVTNERYEKDGVINVDAEGNPLPEAPVTEAPAEATEPTDPADPSATPAPTAIPLPSNIRGTSADQYTCSNGQG